MHQTLTCPYSICHEAGLGAPHTQTLQIGVLQSRACAYKTGPCSAINKPCSPPNAERRPGL